MNVKEAFEDFAKRLDDMACFVTSHKVSNALEHVAAKAREVSLEIAEDESPHAPSTLSIDTIARAKHIEGFEAGRKHERSVLQGSLDDAEAALARTKAERDAFQQAARNAQEDAKLRIAGDLSACREAAEGLRAQRDNALAEVERLKGDLAEAHRLNAEQATKIAARWNRKTA